MPNFDIFLYDKPIEVIRRWVGGLELATAPYADAGTGTMLMREPETYEPFHLTKKKEFGPRFTRLTSYQGSGNVTVLETATNPEELLGVDDFVSGCAGAHYIRCRNFQKETDVPRLTEFTVLKQNAVVRSVMSRTGEGKRSSNRWTFIESGPRQRCEKDVTYASGQITETDLIQVLKNLGLDLENYMRQQVSKVVEFGLFAEGQDLLEFEKEAQVIAPSIAALMSDDAFDEFFDD